MQRGQHRGSTVPMDFEWTNQNGPVDPSSPFMNIHKSQPAQKRPTSVLDSPSKSGFATPNRPFHIPNDSSKPLPLPPHIQGKNTWEPRTPTSMYDFSSGGETPTTPQVDSDAATPDTQLADRMGRLGNGEAHSPKKLARRESWFKRAFMGSPSPIKEREKEDTRKHSSRSSEHRVQKRRSEKSERSRSSKRLALQALEEDSDKEHTSSQKIQPQDPAKLGQTYAMSIAGFLHWLEAHPHLPGVLSYYLQLAVNFALAAGFMYIVYSTWAAIISDVDIESSKHMSEVMVDIAQCAKQYNANRCRPEEVVPAMEKLCGTWETCMNRDPRKVARASVTAKTFAIIVNSFVEEFSWKSIIFTMIIIFGGFSVSNWAFGFLRSQQSQQHQRQATPNVNDYNIPQTPHRIPSNNYIEYDQYGYQQNWHQTPYHTPYANMRHPDGPPLLLHSSSAPVVPTASQEGGVMEKTPRRKGVFR